MRSAYQVAVPDVIDLDALDHYAIFRAKGFTLKSGATNDTLITGVGNDTLAGGGNDIVWREGCPYGEAGQTVSMVKLAMTLYGGAVMTAYLVIKVHFSHAGDDQINGG